MKEAIKVQKIPTPDVSPLKLLAQLCFHYPQYTLKEARTLPYKHVVLLIKTAQAEKAKDYLNHAQIAAAPHSKKGMGYKKLISKYKEQAKNG